VRTHLKRAGPGVLKRSLCHNDEELVSMDSKNQHDPFEFFSFHEGEKIWWFDICSILSCLDGALHPVNPYTRQLLSVDTRRRLRTVLSSRLHRHMKTSHVPKNLSFDGLVELNWTRVSQVLHENGFEDVEPRMFSRLTKSNLLVLLGYLVVDMGILASEHPKSSKRHLYHAILKREHGVANITTGRTSQIQVSSLISGMMHDMVDPYPFCFLVMSALYRL